LMCSRPHIVNPIPVAFTAAPAVRVTRAPGEHPMRFMK
jgi:hypothetical protein